MSDTTTITNSFLEDILKGLKGEQKRLSSKYFYDEKGDKLFQQIMHLEEYYLTRKELEIFTTQKEAITDAIADDRPFRIIELGAGDGLKTKILLKHFLSIGLDFKYTPVDISGNVLEILAANLLSEMPDLQIEPYQGDYFKALAKIATSPERDVVFFLGSNIGNFSGDDAPSFLGQLQTYLSKDDLLFMGVDLKKDPSIILRAYNDDKGITRAFNLNLLDRVNKEIGADFDTDQFQHYPYYNPQTGECRSYLISKIKQDVTVAEEIISFRAWEAIFMEISKKYDHLALDTLANQSGFEPLKTFTDSQGWFSDVIWRKG